MFFFCASCESSSRSCFLIENHSVFNVATYVGRTAILSLLRNSSVAGIKSDDGRGKKMGCCRSDRNQIHQKMLPTVSITKISKGCHPLSVRRLKGTQAFPAVPQGNEQQCEAEMQKSACSRRKADFPLKRGDVRNKQSVDLQPKSLFSELATKCSNSATHTKLESRKMAAGSQNLKYLVWTDHILFSELEGTSRTSFCREQWSWVEAMLGRISSLWKEIQTAGLSLLQEKKNRL